MSNLEERNKSLSFGSMHTASSDSSSIGEPQLIADAEEIIPTPMISKKGYINIFDQPQHRNQWSKFFVVSIYKKPL